MAQLKVTWTRSYIGRRQAHRKVILALGLRRLHQSVVHRDTPTIRGMIDKVKHLLAVSEVTEGDDPSP